MKFNQFTRRIAKSWHVAFVCYGMFLSIRVGKSLAETPTWAGFRGNQAMGSTDSRDLPWQWSATQNIVWKTRLPGAGASSPVVWGDHIYLTCYTGYFVPGEDTGDIHQLKRHLLAIDRNDGRIVWDQAVDATLPEEDRIRDHGYAASTPVADADRVYVSFGKSGVHAIHHDGQAMWQTDVGQGTSGWGSSASPVVYQEKVFINASVESETLFALDRTTGAVLWKVGGIKESWNTPLVVTAPSGRAELILAIHGKVLALNPDTGELLWSCDTDIGWYMVPTVVEANGVIYCLGGRSGTAALAVRAGGSGDVTDTHRLWTSIKGSNVSSPVLYGKHLYWMHEQRGIAYCALAATGEIQYEQRLEQADQVYASALRAANRLYYVTRNGRTFVLAADPTFQQLAVNDLSDGSVFNASPAVDGKRLLIRSDKFLYCVGADP